MRAGLQICLTITLAGLVIASSVHALTADQWQQDLAALRTAIVAHPAPFQKISKAELDQRADALAAEISSLQDVQVVARMAALVVLLGDGHSRVTLPVVEGAELFTSHRKNEASVKIPPFGHFPIRFTRATDGLVVTRTTAENKDLLGAELIGIGERTVAEVEAAVRPLVHGDNRHQQDYLLLNFMVVPEVLAAVGIGPKADRLEWKFQSADGKEISREFVANHDAAPPQWIALGEPAKQSPDKRHWTNKLPHGVVYSRLEEIMNDPNETVEQFAEKAFASLDSTPNGILVLDLRDNPGGDNTLDDSVVRAAIRSKRLWEPGRFFVLINPGTFSAASNLVTLLERWTPAIFVGQPTGGSPNGYGDPKRTVLPNSGLTLRVSSLYWQFSHPKDKREATEPLFTAAPTVASLRAKTDVAREFVQSLIAEPTTGVGTFGGKVAIPGQTLEVKFVLSKEGVSLDLPAARTSNAQLKNFERRGSILRGTAAMGETTMTVHGRLTGRRFLGYIEFNGRPCSFATELAEGTKESVGNR